MACAPSGAPREHVPETDVAQITTSTGTTFGYLEAGSAADGPLVIMLHGFPDTAHTWDRVRGTVAAAGFHVVAPFLPGYAPTSIPSGGPEAFRSERLGQELLALIDALGVETAILVGHDFGALTSYAATQLAPEKISKLVTVALPHPGGDSDIFVLWRARHFFYLSQENAEEGFRQNDFQHVGELYQRWSPLWTPPTDLLDAVKNCYAFAPSTVAALDYYRALLIDGPPAPFLEAPIAVPALTFAGMSDSIITEAMWDASAPFFTGRHELVKLSGGHWVHRENEAEFLEQLLPFLLE